MAELSLFKLHKKTELLDVTQTITIAVNDWNQYTEGEAVKNIDLNPYGYNSSNGVKCIVAPDYSEYNIINNLVELSQCSISVTAAMSDKILQLTFTAEQNPTFEIKAIVQLMAVADTIGCSVISSFPIGDGGSGTAGVSGIKVGNSTATGEVTFAGGVSKSGNTITVADEKVKLTDVSTEQDPVDHSRFKAPLIFADTQIDQIVDGNQYSLCYTPYIPVGTSVDKNSEIFVMPYQRRIYAKQFHDTNFSKQHLWLSSENQTHADFDKTTHTFEVGIRNNTTQSGKISDNYVPHYEWLSRIKFSPTDGTKQNRITIDTPKLKLQTQDIDIDGGNIDTNTHYETNLHGIYTNAKFKTLRISDGITYKTKSIEQYIARTASVAQGVCIIGYDNAPYSECFTRRIPSDSQTVTERAKDFYDVMNEVFNLTDDSNHYIYNEFVLMPGIYYLTSNILEITRGNIIIRGQGQSTKIYWSETDLDDSPDDVSDPDNPIRYNHDRAMIEMNAGNITLKNLQLCYYMSYASKQAVEGRTSTQDQYDNVTYSQNALIRLNNSATGIVLDEITFGITVIQSGVSKADLNTNGFTYDSNGLRMKEAPAADQHNNKINDATNRQYLLAQAVYVTQDKNLGVYNCVGSDEFTKYIVYRQTSTNCASTAVGCRCVARKPWYSMNIPCTGCTAYDSNIETTSSNTQGWESPAVFEIKNH